MLKAYFLNYCQVIVRHNLEESLSGSFTFVFLYEIRTIPDEGDKVTMDPGVDAMVLPQVVFRSKKVENEKLSWSRRGSQSPSW